jgi:hypothetical protein
MSATFKTYVEVEIEVEYSYSKATKGARDSDGVPLEPDESESVEIINVTFQGKEVELDAATTKRLDEEALEDAHERLEAALEDKDESQAEDRRLGL